jgi:hypothetical protein
MSKKKASAADKFATLFDQDWAHTQSRIRTRLDDNRVYDVTNSWDSRSDNPRSFSRLDQTAVPYQNTAPIVLSGTAVVPLEANTGFSAINVKHPEYAKTTIPLTLEQQDVQMRQDLSGYIPLKQQLSQEQNPKKVIIMEAQSGFENYQIKAPTLTSIEKPAFALQAGNQADQKLLNPKQRRELYHLEKQELEAKQLLKKAQFQRNHTKEIMSGPFYKRGVLMVDSSDNVSSEVYGAQATEEMADKEYMRQIHLERMSRLANKQSSMQIYGNLLVPDTLGPRVKIAKPYQSKGGDYHALSFDETHNRLFCRLQGSRSSNRTQLLRDTESSGKEYTITQHTLIEHWPPRKFDRLVEKDMDHPSQQALEHGRNLQGSFRPL